MNSFLSFLDRRSLLVLFVLTLFFLALETHYAIHRPLSIDEFNGGRDMARVETSLPYRDYQPYKPVVGYYTQMALLRLAPDTWNGFITVRLGMAYLAGSVLFLGALWLRRLFRPAAVCLAYALLIVMTSVVEWGMEVRLDLLTSVVGFVSLLLLLNRRIALAGLVAGFSFLISQKGTMYALAGGVSLLGCLLIQRDRRYVRDVVAFGACALVPVGVYVLFWSLLVSFPQVCGQLFFQPTQLHALTTKAHFPYLYSYFWMETVFRNPLFYIFGLWALGSLLFLGLGQTPRDTLLLFYGGVVVTIMLSLRQPWAYCFVLLAPTLFVLQVYLFSRELDRPNTLLQYRLMWVCYLLVGLLWPLSRVPLVSRADPGGQRQTVVLTEALLGPEDRYFAGFELLLHSNAHAKALPFTDTNGAIPIQDVTTAESARILERLQEEPIRVVVYNYKIDNEVPQLIRTYLYRNYAPFWSNVWLYAPQVKPADSEINLLFTDSYTIETEEPQFVRLDGHTYASGTTVALERGRHTIATPARLRLKLQPTHVAHLLNPAYREPIGFFYPDPLPPPPHARTGVWVDD